MVWDKNTVVYQVFIDRFAGFESEEGWDEPEFLGGSLEGVYNKLDYLEDLGVDVIWLSPFYETSAYHGYHITDFFSVDPNFGTEEDLENIIEEAHSRDIEVIADFVPNHLSHKHPYFVEAQENLDSEYHDWFYWNDWPDNYLCFLEFEELPKINLDNTEAREHIIKAAEYWLDKGLDGYRLDHVEGPSNNFWEEFHTRLKQEYPDRTFIGEVWMRGIKYRELETLLTSYKRFKWFVQQFVGAPPTFHQKSYIGLMDGLLDFRAKRLIDRYVRYNSKITKKVVKTALKLHYSRFPDNFYLPVFLDNHDMNRFLYRFEDDKDKLVEALELQLDLGQPTIIYYGTEVGLSHSKGLEEGEEHGDLQARRPMKWEDQDEELLKSFRDRLNRD